MKKTFSEPEMELELFEDDIICLSIGDGDDDEKPINSTSKDT